MLQIDSLTKRYSNSDVALKGVSLNLRAGEVVGLIGPSGAGKSTLIRCVNRLVTPTSGRIALDGQDLALVSGSALRRVRRQIGMIFQEYALVERLTVMENLLSGRLGYVGFWRSWARRFDAQDIARAFELLARVGLAGMENKRADALSGGQRQRVGIARALMQQPRLLLVDEPTASLDPKTSRQIMRLIMELCAERGLAAIVNIHDVVLATQYLPRIVGLQAGQIVYDGPAAELDAGALTRIYGDEDWTAITRKHSDQMQQAGTDGARAAAYPEPEVMP
ncbi:phosphonate ABC transporter ATP-binding protein [Lampropedia cohaerens]|uniref:Phosphonate ABC transporter ATP-binding protein n=1 Tax=Lampropedia cohaerens TaxID=1610491 RepID=A0A0U1Q1B3_9BURK|nr:phosphonate ABC transporter ATP-binding protein [Lampropedia cohaerens]KKW68542.1 phosphonate ABC transporter ATP-binding protein [Lampropedia cohaerens]